MRDLRFRSKTRKPQNYDLCLNAMIGIIFAKSICIYQYEFSVEDFMRFDLDVLKIDPAKELERLSKFIVEQCFSVPGTTIGPPLSVQAFSECQHCIWKTQPDATINHIFCRNRRSG